MKRKTALYGLLIALAFIVSYLESLIPLPVAIQGIKLGLANGVVLVALYRLRWWDGLVVSVLRILLAGLTFGSPVSMLYSLCGGLLSLGVMELCRRSEEDFAAAWAEYRTLCAAGGSRDYPGLMQLAHLPVAYAAGSAKAAAAFVRNKLNLYKN